MLWVTGFHFAMTSIRVDVSSLEMSLARLYNERYGIDIQYTFERDPLNANPRWAFTPIVEFAPSAPPTSFA